MSNEQIYNKIYNKRNKIIEYEDSIDYLRKAKKKSLKIENALDYITATHYYKVCDYCNEAIGYQELLISALKVNDLKIYEYNNKIQKELDSAINILEDKITSLEFSIRSLYSELE